jgi:hypothetical protein
VQKFCRIAYFGHFEFKKKIFLTKMKSEPNLNNLKKNLYKNQIYKF